MRLFAMGVVAVLVALYAVMAVHLYRQELWAREPDRIAREDLRRLEHPEAILGWVRLAFAENDYSDGVRPRIEKALSAAPASYQSTFLWASFHANRLEEPALTRRAFEASLVRYRANGRLHLAYAGWLLGGWPPGGSRGTEAEAVDHLREAVAVEPDLTRDALSLLERHGSPPERWMEVVPNAPSARRELVFALARAGHRARALEELRRMLAAFPESELAGQAAIWAFEWGDLDLALDAARRWMEAESSSTAPPGSGFARAALQAVRVRLARGEIEEAYRDFRSTLAELEERAGEGSASALELLTGVGYEYLRRGHPVTAESLFSEALAVAPHHAPAALGLARSYRTMGEREAAIEQYRRLLRLAPQSEEAERELATLMMEELR